MEEILKYFIEFIFLKFIYRYQKRANDVRQDLASTFQGHLVEKNYLTTSFFFKFNYIERARHADNEETCWKISNNFPPK